jgi:hypothetical protein
VLKRFSKGTLISDLSSLEMEIKDDSGSHHKKKSIASVFTICKAEKSLVHSLSANLILFYIQKRLDPDYARSHSV